MSIHKKVIVLASILIATAGLASATSLSFTPSPSGASCVTGNWWADSPNGYGCETGQNTTFGSSSQQWTVTQGTIDFVTNAWWSWVPAGTSVIDLSGASLGQISTTISGLTYGVTYVLTFDYTYNPDSPGTAAREAVVNMTNAGQTWATGYDLEQGSLAVGAYQSFSETFTLSNPASNSVTLSFTALSNPFQSIVLKNDISYSVSSVPEPLSIGLIGAGLMLIGLKRFRKA